LSQPPQSRFENDLDGEFEFFQGESPMEKVSEEPRLGHQMRHFRQKQPAPLNSDVPSAVDLAKIE
jgi:hypothetical protein